MAKSVAAVDIEINGGQAINSMRDLKKSLKDANFEVFQMREKFGETSIEAINAAKKVAEIKDAIGDAKEMSDAFNPDQKFKALSESLSVVAGGFAAVQGAQALLGSESEDLQKALVKVQGAMALSQGISELGKAGDAFKNLASVAKSAMKGISGAIAATGIGALIVALGIVYAYWDDIKSAIFSTNAAQAQLKVGMDAYKDALTSATTSVNTISNAFEQAANGTMSQNQALDMYNETLGDSMGRTDDFAVAQQRLIDLGPSYIQMMAKEAQIQALLAEQAKLSTQSLTANAEDQTSFMEKFASYGTQLLTSGAISGKGILKIVQKNNVETIKSHNENLQKLINDQVAITQQEVNDLKSKTGLKDKADIEYQKKVDARNKEAANKRKQENDKRIAEEQRLAEELRKINEDYLKQIEKLKEENFLNSIKDEDEKAKETLRINMLARQKEIESSKASAELKAQLLHEESVKYWAGIKAIDDNAAIEQQKKNEENFNTVFAQMEAENQAELEANLRKNEILKKQDEEMAKARIDLYKSIGSALGELSDLIGKDTAAGKALAVAQATINTWLGVTEVLKQKSVLPEPMATISKVANVAAIVAAGIKSVKSIIATKVPNAGGGGASSNLSSAGMTAPMGAQLSSTALNQQMINQMSAATTRAFVLESDVSGNQERITRLNRAARIN
jgi:hypothetical protein